MGDLTRDAETVRLAIWSNVAGEEAANADDALSRICVEAQKVAGLEKALADECANSLRLVRRLRPPNLDREERPRLSSGGETP